MYTFTSNDPMECVAVRENERDGRIFVFATFRTPGRDEPGMECFVPDDAPRPVVGEVGPLALSAVIRHEGVLGGDGQAYSVTKTKYRLLAHGAVGTARKAA